MRVEDRNEGQVSVVIPTLNAAETLPALLAQLRCSTILKEIIVVDGGSSDQTVAIAAAAGARVIKAARGRGIQLAAGADDAAADWLLFLHADCRLAAGWEASIAAFLGAPEGTSRAGYFDFALDDDAPTARRLERLVAWRCRLVALPYGDQGLLIPRGLYHQVGGFARLPLMEDVDLVRRLGRRRLARIAARCITSSKRYRREGYWLRSMRNLVCLSLYFAGVPPHRIARLYG
ncbi:MAG: TIGR04283 family arsenosugar biosynthesis glycosyltransferase [Alphaproteobacteria bacterium]|nr:TIGR04283 family arsenosugar biosynthesis glycosyltransferase [Alphaproteobacteria bacterium]MBV9374838.1 TIGR04283 family arsenosugar biosynthesis glycosyltransferase [Alphaproteobacteria bacterium]